MAVVVNPGLDRSGMNNRSVDDAVNMALHFILQHLDSPGSYARILFVDFSSAFNTIIPALLRDKLFQLNVPDSMCSWITDFLTDRRQFVRLGTHVSDLQHISTGSPQGCVLSPLLFSLYTNGCTSGHQSVKLLKFADDTTLIGLISDGDESAYRGEIDRLVSWCSTNNLELNSLKTVEMTVDFRKNPAPRPPVILCDSPVSSAESFCFLGTTITKELKWEQNIRSLTKKAQQRMYFLRQLKKFLLPVKMLVNFYTAIIESVLTSSITVWFAAATARDKAKLQRVIHSAEKVIGCSLPSLQELYVSRSRRRAAKIAADSSHPGNELFRRSKLVLKQVKTWPSGATSALLDCFDCTDWNMFREAATNGDSIKLKEYTTSVTSYISKCIDDVTVSKTIAICSNQKPCMTAKVRALLKLRDSTFRAGDKTALKTTRAKLSRAIREAKRMHAQRIHGHLQDSGDSRCMLQSIQTNNTTSPACDSDASLPDA
ncbi:hypothetical protein QTP70_006918 [Hemibagrus guttatus]|uniref:Reverse transcriptase domain-containing protein n=1 Tax=Hemibagrus guttatus TaxID=175788 RepID=A0AAE0VC12_9TELE|nr:hypothetical protein QTP70_006918 [Hemibagrus guttatus]KAK3574031.1 hypothetical protein QTP86_000797 [Hemibagrus guttatus]